MYFSADASLLPRYMKLFTSFREPPVCVEMCPFWSKHMYSVLSAFTWIQIPPASCSKLYSRDSTWEQVIVSTSLVKYCVTLLFYDLMFFLSLPYYFICTRFQEIEILPNIRPHANSIIPMNSLSGIILSVLFVFVHFRSEINFWGSFFFFIITKGAFVWVLVIKDV